MRVLAILVLLALAGPAWGQSCTASASGESFGTYNPLSGTATTSTATLTVTCQNTVSVLISYTVALDGGGGGAVNARSMAGGGGRLPYQLYRDPARTQVWGDGSGGSATLTDGYLLGVTSVLRSYAAYGVIPAGSRVAAGTYSDLITIVLSY